MSDLPKRPHAPRAYLLAERMASGVDYPVDVLVEHTIAVLGVSRRGAFSAIHRAFWARYIERVGPGIYRKSDGVRDYPFTTEGS